MVGKRWDLGLFLKILIFLLNSIQGLMTTEVEELYMRKASEYVDGEEYDYIVIGGGTAGCPLAATLSERYKVAVLERGGSPFGNLNITRLENFHISLADTSPESSSQAFISTDGVINARARVLGGGTCINAGFYTRANPRFIRDMGWDGNLVNESYPWIERQIVYKPKIAPWQAAVRDGLVQAGVSPFNGYTYDHLYGTKFGGTIFDDDEQRHTAAELLRSGNHDNLRVYLHANVHKIVFDHRGGGRRRRRRKLKAEGVRFQDENGRFHTILLRRNSPRSEVILSAGAIGSPQLLMLSGIGPKNHLQEKGIPVLLHNRYVGKGMSDNPMNSIFVPSKAPIKQSLIQTVGITKMGSYIEASSGFGQSSDSIKCNHGIMSAEIGQLSTIPPKNRTMEMMRAYAESKHTLPREVFQGGFILEKVTGPLSRGHLRLSDTDPRSNPSVTFNYFSHPSDLRRCVYGIQTIARVIQTGGLASLTHFDRFSMKKLLRMSLTANVNLIPNHINDTQSLQQFCRDTVITIWHYHGGCHVGRVVDGDYRLIGARRLRVIDGSIFVTSPGTNPQATVLMMGRYMGVKILRERSRAEAGSRL